MPTIEFQGDDSAAIEYIRKRGYASYSSIKNVRDCVVPSVSDAAYFKFGKELHSRVLEKTKLETLSAPEETQLKEMTGVLHAHPVVNKLLTGAQTEVELRVNMYGVPVLMYIDIWNGNDLADLKTTRHTSPRLFAESMDFLQAAVYLKATAAKNFFYLGISKQKPYAVMPFNVHQYPDRMDAAHLELRRLLMYIKSKL